MCPRIRSKLSSIQLLLLVKYESVVEFGIEKIMGPIIEDVRKLESVSLNVYSVQCHLANIFIYRMKGLYLW